MTTDRYMHWRLEDDQDGVIWLYLDVSGENVNTLSTAVLSELDSLLEGLESQSPRGAAIISGKTSGFIAGADVKEFTRLDGREDALNLIKRGQGIMDRIEAVPFPVVAVINGFCMGGGTELALACDYRIALDDPRTRIGLPEIKLGIHPGYGGTARSLRIAGPLAAMDLMLSGRALDTRKAKRIGLLDHVVPERHLRHAVRHLIETRPRPRRASPYMKLMNLRPIRDLVAHKMRKQVASKARQEHYPAPYALIDLWLKNAGNERRMLAQEALSVADLSTTETAHNLLRVYMLQNRLKSTAAKALMDPKHVHVVGGGLMGGDIAIWCALQGLRVTVQDANRRSLAVMVQRAAGQFDRRFKTPRRVKAALDRLIPDHNGSGLHRADVVIEAIFEDIEAKRTLYRDIEPELKPDALIATNTSSIPIDALANDFDDPGRLVGLHFFNPVAQLPLVEVVCGEHTRPEVANKAISFARHIDKLPLKVQSSPGFLVNRILTPYLLEAVLMENEGVPKSIIDGAARNFGMPMGPLELADAVGLDVALKVGEILSRAYGFQIPERLKTLVENGHLGRKTQQGFYHYKTGKPIKETQRDYEGDIQELQQRLILRLINESLACLREGVVEDTDLVDAGVIFGTGFAPFRGGPLHYLESQGSQSMRQTLKKLEERYGHRFAADSGWALVADKVR